MGDSAKDRDAAPAPVPVFAIEVPRFVEDGFYWNGCSGNQFQSWTRVERARAALVGEPEGVRAIVFDLVIGDPPRVLRFCCDPLDGAQALAGNLVAALGGRCSKVLRDFAREGHIGWAVPDLALLDELFAAGGDASAE